MVEENLEDSSITSPDPELLKPYLGKFCKIRWWNETEFSGIKGYVRKVSDRFLLLEVNGRLQTIDIKDIKRCMEVDV